ncbi:MAG: DNA methyltransferase [Candidatus Methylomirabilales bacterium]
MKEQQGNAKLRSQPRSSTVRRFHETSQLALPILVTRASPTSAERVFETREALQRILRQDLSFDTPQSPRALHNTHAFAAKFPPELPRLFIEGLTNLGEIVCDPMAGSGTAVAEAVLLGRIGVAVDVDPLAIKLSATKTSLQNPKQVKQVATRVLERIGVIGLAADPWRALGKRYDQRVVDFFRYWFTPRTIQELTALIERIRRVRNPSVRRALEVAFSSAIVTKSGGVSLARDLAHSRPHKVSDKKVRPALDAFAERVEKLCAGLSILAEAPGRAITIMGDARSLPLADNSVALIVTSPPYANAIDYPRAHKFSLFWLGEPYDSLAKRRPEYIGAEVKERMEALPSSTATLAVESVARRDKDKAAILFRYFRDMHRALQEMFRVLEPARAAVIVVGSSRVRDIDVQTPLAIAELGAQAGFKLVGMAERPLSRNHRLMPIAHRSTRAGIEARIHEEQVIAFLKEH